MAIAFKENVCPRLHFPPHLFLLVVWHRRRAIVRQKVINEIITECSCRLRRKNKRKNRNRTEKQRQKSANRLPHAQVKTILLHLFLFSPLLCLHSFNTFNVREYVFFFHFMFALFIYFISVKNISRYKRRELIFHVCLVAAVIKCNYTQSDNNNKQ